MNDLEKYIEQNAVRLIDKWRHYLEVYERHFSRFRGTDVHLVEFGVYQGGSLQMWKHYFGPRCRLYGVDINPECKRVEEEQIEVIIGDQESRPFLRSLAERIPRIDILIDDGGHTMKQQIRTYEELFPHVSEDGVYLCEDLHTSYWPDHYGGGYRRRGTFIEYSKNFIDHLNAMHSVEPKKLSATDFTRSAFALHYYDSILVIEKRHREKPQRLKKGCAEIPDWTPPKSAWYRGTRAIERKLKQMLGRSSGSKT